MKENLRVSKYRNGDTIPQLVTWHNSNFGGYGFPDDNPSNEIQFGKIYNGHSILDPRCLCPIGWHVPSDSEWNILTKFLDPFSDTTNQIMVPSSIAGGKMKSTGTMQLNTGLWEEPNLSATNSSGFNGLPAGYIHMQGIGAHQFGKSGIWWGSTSTLGGSYLAVRVVSHDRGDLTHIHFWLNEGASVDKSSLSNINCGIHNPFGSEE